jgi:hypothetical protein
MERGRQQPGEWGGTAGAARGAAARGAQGARQSGAPRDPRRHGPPPPPRRRQAQVPHARPPPCGSSPGAPPSPPLLPQRLFPSGAAADCRERGRRWRPRRWWHKCRARWRRCCAICPTRWTARSTSARFLRLSRAVATMPAAPRSSSGISACARPSPAPPRTPGYDECGPASAQACEKKGVY